MNYARLCICIKSRAHRGGGSNIPFWLLFLSYNVHENLIYKAMKLYCILTWSENREKCISLSSLLKN